MMDFQKYIIRDPNSQTLQRWSLYGAAFTTKRAAQRLKTQGHKLLLFKRTQCNISQLVCFILANAHAPLPVKLGYIMQ